MNKRVKKLVTVLAALVLLVQVGMVSAFAADDGYTYTIRVYAGNGTFSGGTVMEQKCHYGDDFPFSVAGVTGAAEYDDARYFVRGVRESGKDNDTISAGFPRKVEGDADYVIAYGLRGQLVSYTIYFVDEAGNQIPGVEPQTYYGNVGDKPVVSFLYIEGYEPLAYNIAKTLSANEAENNWNFPYRAIPAAEAAAPAAPAAPATATDAAAAGDAGADAGAAAAGAEGEEAGAAGAQDETTIDEEEAPLDQGPDELLDLDEGDTPLAQQPTERQQEQAKDRTMMFASIGILAVALAALIAFIILLAKSRKEEKDAR